MTADVVIIGEHTTQSYQFDGSRRIGWTFETCVNKLIQSGAQVNIDADDNHAEAKYADGSYVLVRGY